jgi:hypothetical protein
MEFKSSTSNTWPNLEGCGETRCYNVPKLRISSAAMKLARNIGKQFTTSSLSVSSIDKGSNDSMSTSENVSEDDISTSSHDNTNTTVDDLPNASEYPVFHSHGLKLTMMR